MYLLKGLARCYRLVAMESIIVGGTYWAILNKNTGDYILAISVCLVYSLIISWLNIPYYRKQFS